MVPDPRLGSSTNMFGCNYVMASINIWTSIMMHSQSPELVTMWSRSSPKDFMHSQTSKLSQNFSLLRFLLCIYIAENRLSSIYFTYESDLQIMKHSNPSLTNLSDEGANVMCSLLAP